jgi:hypothetical protein
VFRPLLVSVLVTTVVTGCGQVTTHCPAVGHFSTFVVRLDDGWPLDEARTVTLRCPEDDVCDVRASVRPEDVLPEPEPHVVPFDEPRLQTGPPPATPGSATQTLRDGTAEFVLGSSPGPVLVTVSEAGEDVVSMIVQPEWVRVGGSEECGGPQEAEVVVPAP